MNKILLIGFAFMIGSASSKPLLIAKYKTVSMVKARVHFPMKEAKTSEDSILLEFTNEFVKDLSEKPFKIVTIDSVTVFSDSAIVEKMLLTQESNFYGGNVKYNIRKTIFKNGNFYSSDENSKANVDENTRKNKFIPLSLSEKIAGYNASSYISEDGSIKLWATKELPSLLNPGIKTSTDVGGILKYEIKDSTGSTTSVLEYVQQN